MGRLPDARSMPPRSYEWNRPEAALIGVRFSIAAGSYDVRGMER